MIAKVAARGTRLRGLIEYLYGPGKAEEHTNPHLVAAWDNQWLSTPQDRAGRDELTRQMQGPRRLFEVQVPDGAVYHVAISVHRDDGELGDDAWRRVAERTADKLGFTAREGRAGCRWIAVHHGRTVGGHDHIHFVADLVREDGNLAVVGDSDYYALAEMRQEMQAELGLRVRTHSNRHGERAISRGEMAAAGRRGRPEPDRTALARRVRAAAAGARAEAEFVIRMRRDGLLVRPRWAAGQRAERVVGYSVALRPAHPGEKPVWYGGGRLGRDLSLPALRQRWPTPSTSDQAAALAQWRPKRWRHQPAARVPKPRQLRPRAWEAAGDQVAATRRRLAAIAPEDRDRWASAAREASGTLAALAQRLQPGQRAELARAADALARAGQVPRGQRRGYRDPVVVALSGVARVATDAYLINRGGTLLTATLLHEMAELAAEVGRAHAAAARADEARAGAAAAEHTLAYTRAATRSLAEPERSEMPETTTPPWSGSDTGPYAEPTPPHRDRPVRDPRLGIRLSRPAQRGRDERGRG